MPLLEKYVHILNFLSQDPRLDTQVLILHYTRVCLCVWFRFIYLFKSSRHQILNSLANANGKRNQKCFFLLLFPFWLQPHCESWLLCEWCELNLPQFILRKMKDIWMIQSSLYNIVTICIFLQCIIFFIGSFKCCAPFFNINNDGRNESKSIKNIRLS